MALKLNNHYVYIKVPVHGHRQLDPRDVQTYRLTDVTTLSSVVVRRSRSVCCPQIFIIFIKEGCSDKKINMYYFIATLRSSVARPRQKGNLSSDVQLKEIHNYVTILVVLGPALSPTVSRIIIYLIYKK